MKTNKLVPFIFLISVLVAVSLACNLGAPSELDQDASVEATVRAVEDKRATDEAELPPLDLGEQPQEPSPTEEQAPEASPTPQSTNTPVPTPTATEIPCDRAAFVSDVSVPDGEDHDPGDVFTKTWRLKNTGSCTWTSGYDLVFDHGDQMGAPASVQLTGGSIGQNQNVDVSVQLTAPGSEGRYKGFFKLRNPQGGIFGIGPNGNVAFWVEIEVIEPAAPPDLVVTQIILDPYPPTKNDPVTVTVRIKNNGAATGESFAVKWWGGENFPSPAKTWNVNLGLGEGETKDLVYSYAGYSSWYGSINTKAQVDTGDTVGEGNEGNNILLRNIQVNP